MNHFTYKYPALTVYDEKLKNSLSRIYDYSEEIMSNLIDRYFTDHSITHLNRILLLIDEFLCKNEKKDLLNDHEKYCLIAATLLHDIGMQKENIEVSDKERRDIHHKLSVEMVTNEFKVIGIEEDFVRIIGLIMEGHRGNISQEKYSTITIRTCVTIRTDLLASILFLCDELDISHERVSINRKQYLNYNSDSAFHFYKHYFTQGISIGDDRAIRIVFRYPEGRVDQYKELFENDVTKKLHGILSEVSNTISEKFKLFITLSENNISRIEDRTLDPIDSTLLDNIFTHKLGIKNFKFVNKFNFSDFKGDINAELFYKGNVRWADIVNNLDIKRTQYSTIGSKTKLLYDYSCRNQSMTCLLITGEGGSGKTTTLMRVAYDIFTISNYSEANILWLPEDVDFAFQDLKNLHNSTGKPSIVFIDGMNINTTIEYLRNQIKTPDYRTFPILFIFAARLNEWINANGNNLGFSKKEQIILDKLSDNEISDLLVNLEKYDQLFELQDLSSDERFSRLKAKSDGQLLVAMLEATRGKKFNEIILDEYKNIKEYNSDAAKAYEILCLLYVYDVLIPFDLLIILLSCIDHFDFETNVLKYTRLIIVKHGSAKYGLFYRPRHKEIASVLINSIEKYNTSEKQLRNMVLVLRAIDLDQRPQRYVILNFLKNFILHIIKNVKKDSYHDKMDEVRKFLNDNGNKINKIQDSAVKNKLISELAIWSSIYHEVRMINENISTLERVVKINPLEKKANYLLAHLLSRTHAINDNPEKIARYYQNSFMGGNRDMKFLLEFLEFSLKKDLSEALDSIISGFENYITYTDSEVEIKNKIGALLKAYKLNKDKTKLANDFSKLNFHLEATKDLKSADELAYIDLIESKDLKDTLNKYQTFLLTLHPNRPKNVLLRIARTASKIKGEENTSLKAYKEIHDKYINGILSKENYDILFNYILFASENDLQQKEYNYRLFRECIQINKNDLKIYLMFARYAFKKKDKEMAKGIINEGLKLASSTDKYNNYTVKDLVNLKNRIENK